MSAVTEVHARKVIVDESHGLHLEAIHDVSTSFVHHRVTSKASTASKLGHGGCGGAANTAIRLDAGTGTLKVRLTWKPQVRRARIDRRCGFH
jgi:hypothetical protein